MVRSKFLNDSRRTFDAGYRVGINPDVAFTVFYEDHEGKLIFVVDLGDDPKKIYLDPRPNRDGKMLEPRDDAAKSRVSSAVERVKAFLEATGMKVELD